MAAAAAVSPRPHKEARLHKHSANKAANVRKLVQQGDKHLERRQRHVDTVSQQLTCCHLSPQTFTMILATANQRVIAGLYWSNPRRKVDAPAARLYSPQASKACRDATFPPLWVNITLKGFFRKRSKTCFNCIGAAFSAPQTALMWSRLTPVATVVTVALSADSSC